MEPNDRICVDPSVPEKDRVYLTVPEGQMWVSGDNLTHSRDSRTLGPVPLGLLRGKAVFKVWSYSQLQLNYLD